MVDITQNTSETQIIKIINTDGTPRVDSRLVAKRLGIQHESFMKNLSSYLDKFQLLGLVRFEIGEIKGRGQPEKYVLLNEDQTVFALTLSRNTPEVVQLKLDLTVAFRNARHSQDTQPANPLPKNISYFGELSQATLAKCAPNLGVVYAIELDNGYIKIGQTKNPSHRIINLARSYRPFIKVKRVAVTKDCTNYIPLEKQMHKKFAENWFANEYFLVPMLEVVAAMAEIKLRNSGSLQSDLPVHLIWESIKALIECYNGYIQSDYYTFASLQKIKKQLWQLESYYLNDGKINIMRLLLIEDDTLLGNGIQTGLMQTDYAVDWITDGVAGEHALKVEKYDALILDLNLPKKDGLKILKDLRARGDTLPVLILTARYTINDKILGLDSGADDYLVKPFDLDELSARLRALLRRHNGRATPYIEYDNLRLEPATHILTQNGQTVMLSQREFAILQTLLENPGQILSRSRLEESLYGWDDMIESNAVEVHIHHLRKQLGKKLIHTVRGFGYMVHKK